MFLKSALVAALTASTLAFANPTPRPSMESTNQDAIDALTAHRENLNDALVRLQTTNTVITRDGKYRWIVPTGIAGILTAGGTLYTGAGLLAAVNDYKNGKKSAQANARYFRERAVTAATPPRHDIEIYEKFKIDLDRFKNDPPYAQKMHKKLAKHFWKADRYTTGSILRNLKFSAAGTLVAFLSAHATAYTFDWSRDEKVLVDDAQKEQIKTTLKKEIEEVDRALEVLSQN